MMVSYNSVASPAASAGKKMARFPSSWQHIHVNSLNLLSSYIGGKMCVFVFIPLSTKIKLPLYKTDSEWEESMVNSKCVRLC